jgi:hypothetical protein
MHKLLLTTAALVAIATPAAAEPACVWGNMVDVVSREPSGRPGYDSLTFKRNMSAPFYMASGYPEAEAILAGKPVSILFPEGETVPQLCTFTDDAINAVYAAPDAVQAAIETDVCTDPESDGLPFLESVASRAALSDADRVTYDAIGAALGIAYNATEGTDAALEEIQAAFCDAISER